MFIGLFHSRNKHRNLYFVDLEETENSTGASKKVCRQKVTVIKMKLFTI